jgi:hypothetical protein
MASLRIARHRRPRRRPFTASLERLEQRLALAVTAALSAGELRIGFTPSALAEQTARLSNDGSNYIVRNTNNIAIGSFPVASVTAISVTGIVGRELLEVPATSPQPITAALNVAGTIETSVIARGIVTSGDVRIASPATRMDADVVSTGRQVYGGDVTVNGNVLVSGQSVRFESVVSGTVGTSLTIDSPGDATILGGLAGDLRLQKRGGGRLDIESASTHRGGTVVETGEIHGGRSEALGSVVEVVGDGRVSLAPDRGLPGLTSLALAATGRWDVRGGGLTIDAGGYDSATLRSWLTAGRAGGGWNGSTGITSADAALSAGTRTVGYVIQPDGSAKISFAASGDVDLNGQVDVFDLVGIGASATYGTGAPAVWSQGDSNYDGVTNVFDLVATVSGATFGKGPYLPDRNLTQSITETWEGMSTSRLPETEWRLQTGDWGSVEQRDVRGAGRKLAVGPNEITSLMRAIDVTTADHVVLQGWLSDSEGANRSTLGLASFPTVADAGLIRIGATGKGTYRVEYFDPASASIVEVDTALTIEAGWHFFRLDIVQRLSDQSMWDVTWRGWNAAETVEQRGTFAWQFDPTRVNWVTLGARSPTAGAVAWDEIAAGPLADVGPPPALPALAVPVTASASSFLPGWEPAKLVDSNAGSVYSSNGHAGPEATEWAAIDLGRIFSIPAITLTPRPGHACFPVNYEIQFSTDMLHWTTVPGQTYADQPRPEGPITHPVTHVFDAMVQARGLRVYATRLGTDGPDNTSGGHYLQLAGIEVPRFKLDTQPWVKPAELRQKSINSTGIFSNMNYGNSQAPTPRFLAENPDYLANHPFDGVTVPLIIDPEYTQSQGIVFSTPMSFQWIGMSSLPIPWSAVEQSVDYLKQVQWGNATDNFLWYGVQNQTNWSWEDGDRAWWVDPDSEADWQVVVANAAVAARAAREGGLKGFIVDTEQYTMYPTADHPEYPFGLGSAATWRERGRQWIEAVQGAYPEIELQFFFSWGDESFVWPNYQNLVPFMDGVLEGIRDPARIVHAYEGSFWYGKARAIPPGSNSIWIFDADRDPYVAVRDSIRNVWRNYSNDPAKYDDFVDVGMAAWFESDPWNLWPGWPSGYLGDTVPLGRSAWPGMPWSNVANTLAYSDKYVWTWSENTHYAATYDRLNPFMASVANQTFNTGREQVASFTEDFATDPMKNGWYFNFSFMDIGRREAPDDGPPQLVQTTDAVAYAWKEADGAVAIRGNWTRGEYGEIEGLAAAQQRRYVRPVEPLTRSDDIHFEADFTVDAFGTDASNPILIGLFHSEAEVDRQALALRIAAAGDVSLVVAGDGTPWTLPLAISSPLVANRGYRVMIARTAASGTVTVTLSERAGGVVVATVTAVVPVTVGPFVFDEAGVAQREAAYAASSATAYRFRLEAFSLGRPLPTLPATLSSPSLLGFTITPTASEPQGAAPAAAGSFAIDSLKILAFATLAAEEDQPSSTRRRLNVLGTIPNPAGV